MNALLRNAKRSSLGSVTTLLLTVLVGFSTSPRAYAGDRPDIYSFTPVERADLATHMMNYITGAIVNKHLNPPANKHGSSRFMPWHRDYIKGMEDYLISQNRPQFVPLPKWNPNTPIPAQLTAIDPDCPGAGCNPLVNLTPNINLPASLSTGLCSQVVFNTFRATLENSYHNGVHVTIGGAMGNFKSPGAPIFWLWHAFVDDVWFDWQCVCGLDEAGAFAAYTAAEQITDLESGIADAWMRDSADDIANEPNNETTTFWQSGDIWCRNNSATLIGATRYLNEHQHQNPEYAVIPANRPYLYVKVRNRGCTTVSGDLHIYWANASMGLTWPVDFTEVSTSPVTLTNISAGREHVAEFQWLNIPLPTVATGDHFCLTARFVATPASADPIVGEANNVNISANVKNSNQIVWKNVTVVNDVMNIFGVLVRNISTGGDLLAMLFEAPVDQEGQADYFALQPAVIDLGPELYNRWLANGALGQGIQLSPIANAVIILEEGALIQGLPVNPGEEFLVGMQFGPITSCEDDGTVFPVKISAFEGPTLLGGNTYDVAATTVLSAREVHVEAIGSPIECNAGFVQLAITSGVIPGAIVQWFLDGTPIAGAGGGMYTATQSGRYTAFVTYPNGCDRMSPPVFVHVGFAPPNDRPCTATSIQMDTSVAYDTFCATAQAGEVSPGTGSDPTGGCRSDDGWCAADTGIQNSVWFRFTAPASGRVNIRVDDSHDLDHDLLVNHQLALYEVMNCGDYSTYLLLGANDNSGDTGAWGSAPALEGMTLIPGAEYYIQLDGYLGVRGAGTIIVEDDPPTLGTPVCFGVNCPCGNDDPNAGCLNSDLAGGRLVASGSTSLSADDFQLDAHHPPGNSGLCLVNTALDSPLAVFGGLNCVRGGPRVLPGADIGGMQPFGDVDLVPLDGIRNLGSTVAGGGFFGLVNNTFIGYFGAPGVTYHAQMWFRDVLCGPPPTPCPSPCGLGSNMTHALGFTVTP